MRRFGHLLYQNMDIINDDLIPTLVFRIADDGSLVHMNEKMEVVDAIHCISDNVSAVTPDLLQIPKVRWYNTLAEMLCN